MRHLQPFLHKREHLHMSFESGSVSFRGFYLKSAMPDDAVRRFADHALPPIDSLGREPVTGWVTGRHLLDRNITEDSALVAGYLRLTLVKAERKIPVPLLRAECMMEELAATQAEGLEYLKRDQRIKIKKEVTDRLLPGMPPQLKGIPIVASRGDDFVFAGATSEQQCEALMIHLGQALGTELVALTPESAALKRKGHSIRDLVVTSLSPECADEEVSENPGMDFLTWLWFYSEKRGGEIETGHGTYAVMLEGPLTFVMEGSGAHEASLRKGSPLQSIEARTALLGGKKLARAGHPGPRRRTMERRTGCAGVRAARRQSAQDRTARPGQPVPGPHAFPQGLPRRYPRLLRCLPRRAHRPAPLERHGR